MIVDCWQVDLCCPLPTVHWWLTDGDCQAHQTSWCSPNKWSYLDPQPHLFTQESIAACACILTVAEEGKAPPPFGRRYHSIRMSSTRFCKSFFPQAVTPELPAAPQHVQKMTAPATLTDMFALLLFAAEFMLLHLIYKLLYHSMHR